MHAVDRTASDLIIKGGRLFDPGAGLDDRADIAVRDGMITAIGPDLPTTHARRVIDARGATRYVLPGLVNVHAHVGYGATTAGVGRVWGEPDLVGVESGVTTEVDAGSTGVSNVGVFPAHITPRVRTRVLCYLNAGSFAHTVAPRPDIERLEDVDAAAIRAAIAEDPGLIQGFKLRLVGPIMDELGEEIIRRVLAVAEEHRLPLMIHIGDQRRTDRERPRELTRHLLRTIRPGDIVTHYCTPHPGGVFDDRGEPLPELSDARQRGVVFDASPGRQQFGLDIARRQADLGIHPDTLSTDSAATGRRMVSSLFDVMGKYLAVGYSLSDVVRMTTTNAARAIGLAERAGRLAVGREADITVIDTIDGRWSFADQRQEIVGRTALIPVVTIRRGDVVFPASGPHTRGWLPDEADARP